MGDEFVYVFGFKERNLQKKMYACLNTTSVIIFIKIFKSAKNEQDKNEQFGYKKNWISDSKVGVGF